MSLQAENEQLKRENQELQQALAKALKRIEELEARLQESSRNSHWPSSRDKVRLTKSLRQKSAKKAGGQAGHAGQTLAFQERVDEIQVHRPVCCTHCQREFVCEQSGEVVQRRQVIDLPPPRLQVIEHQIERLVCRQCGQESRGVFPGEVTNPVQYGARIQALAVYLKQEQFIPYARSQRFFGEILGVPLSPGTVQNFVDAAAAQLQTVNEQIKAALLAEAVVHFDESGFYIAGKRQWLHSASSQRLTYYFAHATRGKQATEVMGILPKFTGTAQHDNWATYWHYRLCTHALCNAHHLRELTAIAENFAQPWATRLQTLLLAAKAVVEKAKAAGLAALPDPKITQIERVYAKLVACALNANPPPPAGWPKNQRGKPKKTKPRNLAERFQQRQSAVLAFVYNFKVPFDNNLAERDLRMLKVQQKISGCFRSTESAAAFCSIRSYISTMRKQNFSVWQALASLFSGPILQPRYPPV